MKRLLLDTHAFLWWVDAAPALSRRASRAIQAADECWVSLGSAWELAIKISLGRLKLALPLARYFPEHLAANDFRQLEIGFRHVTRLETLDFHHRDPFDRLLAAQALTEGLSIVSADPIFKKYDVKTIW